MSSETQIRRHEPNIEGMTKSFEDVIWIYGILKTLSGFILSDDEKNKMSALAGYVSRHAQTLEGGGEVTERDFARTIAYACRFYDSLDSRFHGFIDGSRVHFDRKMQEIRLKAPVLLTDSIDDIARLQEALRLVDADEDATVEDVAKAYNELKKYFIGLEEKAKQIADAEQLQARREHNKKVAGRALKLSDRAMALVAD